MNLKHGIENADKAHQDYEAGRKEIDDKFDRIFEEKCADQGLGSKNEKKKRQETDQDHLSPPED
jgi:hypothetical protein